MQGVRVRIVVKKGRMKDFPSTVICKQLLTAQQLISYRGRFAPSPTGALHFGSLVAAVGGYLDARRHGGQWFLRIEDVDTPRNVAGAAASILSTLDGFGFEWDGEVIWQSQRLEAYAEALEKLKAGHWVYPCTCTRREIADMSLRQAVDGGFAYPGTCREGVRDGRPSRAWRLRVGDDPLLFKDRLQGDVTQRLEQDVGDFVLCRADGLYAYQLAVTVDDAFQGITDVVRGADLLASTPRQIWLQGCLGLPTPRYAHLPVVGNAAGEKLSKQTLAQPLEIASASQSLVHALQFLGQPIPDEFARSTVGDVWNWALHHWAFERIPRERLISRSV